MIKKIQDEKQVKNLQAQHQCFYFRNKLRACTCIHSHFKFSHYLFYLVVIFFILSFHAAAVDIKDFVTRIEKESSVNKISTFNLNSEKERLKGAKNYYLPIVSVESSLKHENIDKIPVNKGEISLNISSILWASEASHRINEMNYSKEKADVNLAAEHERITIDVLKNVVMIHKYQQLKTNTEQMKKDSLDLETLINRRFELGAITQSSKRQAGLLIKKIENELSIIQKQIEIAKSNIETISGLDYPPEGITVETKVIEQINHYQPIKEEITQNLDYRKLVIESEKIKSMALQQDPAFNLKLTGLQKGIYPNNAEKESETKVYLTFTYNMFDYTKKTETNAQLNSYEASKIKRDLKFFELEKEYNIFLSLDKSFNEEIENLSIQKQETQSLLDDLEKDYLIGKTTYYEILNTEFDKFILHKEITELTIEKIMNKIDMMKLTGKIK